MYTFNIITKVSDLLSIQKEWSELHNNAVNSSIYNSFPFIYNSLESFKDKGTSPFILCISLKEKLIGIYFLQKKLENKYHINLKTIEFSALDEIDKPYPIIHKNFHKAAWTGLYQHLDKEQSWDILKLIEQTHDNISTITSTLNRKQFYRINPDKSGPIISLDQNWDEFYASHKKLRKKISIFSRDFKDDYSIRIEFGTKLLDEYKKVESNSWKNGIQGIQRSSSTKEFYNNFLEETDKSKVVIAILYAKKTAISAELAYIQDDTLYLAQGCYNDEYSKYSPGMISTALLLKKFMEENMIKRADCLCGFAQYLEAWSNQVISTNRLDVYNSTPRVFCFFTARLFNKLVKFWR